MATNTLSPEIAGRKTSQRVQNDNRSHVKSYGHGALAHCLKKIYNIKLAKKRAASGGKTRIPSHYALSGNAN